MSVQNIVHTVRNIMRKDPGVDGDAQRISQMVWLIFLKVFDSMEEEKEAEDPKYKSPLPEEARWRNWASDEEGITGDELLDFINEKVFAKIKDLDVGKSRKASIVKQVFEDTYNYMKNGVLMRQVINEINKIEHLSNLRGFFNSIKSVMNKESKLILTTPNCTRINTFTRILAKGKSIESNYHTLTFSAFLIKNILKFNGFKNIKVYYSNADYIANQNYIYRLLSIVRKEFRSNLVVECNKQ